MPFMKRSGHRLFQYGILGSIVTLSCGLPADAIADPQAVSISDFGIEDGTFTVAQTIPTSPGQLRPNPNQDRFLQPVPTPQPSPEVSPPTLTPPQPEVEPTQPTVPFVLKDIQIQGGTIFDPQEFALLIQPLRGRQVTLNELKSVVDAISQRYIQQGYLTSRAVLPNQTVADGIVQIRIIEGKLEKIEIEGTRRLKQSYVRKRIQRAARAPLNTTKLEEQLRLLQLDPVLKTVGGSLSAGSTIDESVLTVRVKEAPTFVPGGSFDNYSPPSVGGERFGVSLGIRNITGYGDTLAAFYNRTFTGGANVYDVSYRVPLNAMDGTLQLRFSGDDTRVTSSEFEDIFDISGDSQAYEISFRQPLIKTFRREFALSLGFNVEDESSSFAFFGIPLPEVKSRTRVIKFAQDFLSRDAKGLWFAQSQFNFGLGVLGATIEDHPNPDGRFFSWQGQVQRFQNLGKDRLLILGGEIQLTPDSLLPSQQFIIGGGQSVRGYRQNARLGDNGARFFAEARFPLYRSPSKRPIVQLAPFFDAGTIWNHPDSPEQFNQNFLAGLGLGLIFEPIRNLSFRVDYGYPLIDLDDRGNNIQDDGIYFSVTYRPW
jgi:hemolysin activation/secretion protein